MEDDIKIIFNAYLIFESKFKKIDETFDITAIVERRIAENYVIEFQKDYDKLIVSIKSLQEFLFKKEDAYITIISSVDKYSYSRKISELLKLLELSASFLHFKYLTPLTLRLSDFAEKQSEERDIIYFKKSKKYSLKYVIISFFVGLLFSWFFSWFFDNNIDDQTEFEKNILDDVKKINSQIMKNNILLQKLDDINAKFDTLQNKLK